MTGKRTASPSASADLPRGNGLAVEVHDRVAVVALCRPDVHNAFNDTLIAELTHALRVLDADPAVRVVVLTGQGRSFCAGADLEWMQRMAGYGQAENLADAGALAGMLATLARMGKPTIARVHGAAFGGGVGLVACCDIAIAAEEATFALSEVRLGLVPATIGPYVIEAIGAREARRYFLTAERFDAAEALRIGFVHQVVPPEGLDAAVGALVKALVSAGPAAVRASKRLVQAVAEQEITQSLIADTAQGIADIRVSVEGREGIQSFLAKRKPSWLAG